MKIIQALPHHIQTLITLEEMKKKILCNLLILLFCRFIAHGNALQFHAHFCKLWIKKSSSTSQLRVQVTARTVMDLDLSQGGHKGTSQTMSWPDAGGHTPPGPQTTQTYCHYCMLHTGRTNKFTPLRTWHPPCFVYWLLHNPNFIPDLTIHILLIMTSSCLSRWWMWQCLCRCFMTLHTTSHSDKGRGQSIISRIPRRGLNGAVMDLVYTKSMDETRHQFEDVFAPLMHQMSHSDCLYMY